MLPDELRNKMEDLISRFYFKILKFAIEKHHLKLWFYEYGISN